MNQEWSLDVLYKGYDDPDFVRDMESLPDQIGAYRRVVSSLGEGDAKEQLTGLLKAEEELTAFVLRLELFLSLKQSACSTDEQAANGLARIMDALGTVKKDQAAAKRFVASIEELPALIESDTFLSQYRYQLQRAKEEAAHLLSAEAEDVMARMDVSAGQAWGNLQSYLTSTVEVDWQGEKTNLSHIRNLAYDGDEAVRKAAYEAELAAYPKVEGAVAFALNNIKSQANTEAQLRRFDSVLDMTLFQSRMSRETLDALMDSVQRFLPRFRQYLRAKAEVLGHSDGLPWYDLFAPMGEGEKTFTLEEAKEYLVSHFRPFAPDMADMMEEAFDHAWIDFYPRPGKEGGAFCAGYPLGRQSFILTNFGGKLGDVVTLAHELGHAYHNRCLEGNRLLNMDYPMPVAETASTFNETVIMSAAIADAGEKEKLALLDSRLSDLTQSICDIYSRYLFESEVVERRKDSFLFPARLNELMLDAQKKSYGDGLDPQYLHPYMWVCKSHYYSASLNFYNFPYAFGALFALGLYAQYQEEGESFVPKYRALLRATATASVEDVAKTAGIDLTQTEFWDRSLARIGEDIDTFLSLVRQKG